MTNNTMQDTITNTYHSTVTVTYAKAGKNIDLTGSTITMELKDINLLNPTMAGSSSVNTDDVITTITVDYK